MKIKLTDLDKIRIEQARCPRCDYKGVYSYFREDGCCRLCAYPYGYLDAHYKIKTAEKI